MKLACGHALATVIACAGWLMPQEVSADPVASEVSAADIGFALVPAGKVQMREGDLVKEVEIPQPFLLGRTEVTQAQFKKVMGSEPWSNEGNVRLGDDYPAVVTWEDAAAFCEKITERERRSGALAAGEGFRLPTEAEWEYACRAGETTAFPLAEEEKRLAEYAWFEANAKSRGEYYAHRVGMKKPNAWGLYDMQGNVPEWCSDYYAPLREGIDPRGPGSGSRRVFRGGGWWCNAADCRADFRGFVPSYFDVRLLGFRVLRGPVK